MIRPYKPQDKEQLIEIFKRNTPKYFNAKEVDDFVAYLQNHHNTYLTIEHENKIVGGTGYYVNPENDVGQITWIFFHPDAAGLGLGRKAVDHCLEILKSIPNVEKLVVTTSQLAYQFFEKVGYKLIKTEKDYWGEGLDLYWMEMKM